MDDDEEYGPVVTRPSGRMRGIDIAVLLVDFIDDITSVLHGFTTKVLWHVAGHANHTLDQERARQASESTVEII